MSTYNIDEGVFELPGRWKDDTITMLSRPATDGSRFGLVINRHELEEGQDLDKFVSRNIEMQSQSMRGWELLGRRDSVVGALPAIELKVRWLHEGKMVFHHAAYTIYYGRVIMITASSLAKFSEECESFMNRLLPTLKFRER